MKFDKQQIINMLKSPGDHHKASPAQSELLWMRFHRKVDRAGVEAGAEASDQPFGQH